MDSSFLPFSTPKDRDLDKVKLGKVNALLAVQLTEATELVAGTTRYWSGVLKMAKNPYLLF